MTPDERQLLAGLFDRVRSAASAPRDRDAEAFIADQVRAQPYATYLLAQTVIMQEQTMDQAAQRIGGEDCLIFENTRVTAIEDAPAVVRTAILDQLTPEQVKYMTDKIPMRRTGEPEEIAAAISRLNKAAADARRNGLQVEGSGLPGDMNEQSAAAPPRSPEDMARLRAELAAAIADAVATHEAGPAAGEDDRGP